jgi:AraC family transcriptional regulator
MLFRNQQSIANGGKHTMNELNVRTVRLEPMRVASFQGFSASPEHEAAKKLIAWAEPRGLLDAQGKHRIFGFNNPSPSPGSPNYGYEFWITIEPHVKPEEAIEIKEIPEGLYAVARCEVNGSSGDIISATWKGLEAWHEGSKYRRSSHHWLEEHISPRPFTVSDSFVLDLHLPITE